MLEKAKSLLDPPRRTCALVLGDRFYTTGGKGIAPLLDLSKRLKGEMNGCAAADTVVGKAAAMILCKMGAREVYGSLMSEPALEFLKENDIKVSYGCLVPHIENHARTGMCPLEQAVSDKDTLISGLATIEGFVADMIAKRKD